MQRIAAAPETDAPSAPEPVRSSGRRPAGSRRRWIAVAAATVLGLAVWRASDDGPTPLTPADVDRAVQQGVERSQAEQNARPPDATVAYRAISPSLVIVTTDGSTDQEDGVDPGDTALGSGVIINAEGAVLTALHVVAGSRSIQVQFADGTRASAQVAQSQAETDIAVLVVDRLPEIVVPAVMGGVPPVGDAVFAVGNPLGLENTLTAGVVSAHGRSIQRDNGRSLDGLIQFDAAVNSGNSGGPLLNRGGQVVGIVTALANPSKQSYFIGVGFAVPIATAGGVAGGPQQ